MYDQTGPGTPIWIAADDLVEARLRNDRKAQHAARQRLVHHARKHGVDYKEWKACVQREVAEWKKR